MLYWKSEKQGIGGICMKIRTYRQITALLTAFALLAAAVPTVQQSGNCPTAVTASAFDTGARIRVDINKNDGRKASYSKNANNWLLVEGASDS